MIAEWINSNHIWEELTAHVHIHQKAVKHSPSDKLKDLLMNIWAGGARIASINNRVRADESLQRVFGRKSCAEQSPVSETLTRQLAVRWPKEKGGFHYCVLVFNLNDLMLFQLAGVLKPKHLTDQDVFTASLKAYNLRSGGVETSIKNSKQGLGLNKRNKKRFDAQHMLLLLAQLAHNIAVWVRGQLAQHSTTIAKFGLVRSLRDVFRISGKVQFDEKGIVHLIILNQSHQLAKAIHKTWQACFARNNL